MITISSIASICSRVRVLVFIFLFLRLVAIAPVYIKIEPNTMLALNVLRSPAMKSSTARIERPSRIVLAKPRPNKKPIRRIATSQTYSSIDQSQQIADAIDPIQCTRGRVDRGKIAFRIPHFVSFILYHKIIIP